MQPIRIVAAAACSALGLGLEAHFSAFQVAESAIRLGSYGARQLPSAALSSQAEKSLAQLVAVSPHYAELDRSVLLGMLAARELHAGLRSCKASVGVNLGSSRGATQLWEREHSAFLASSAERGGPRTSLRTSPLTTLGNLSSWIAQDLGLEGLAFSHSVTCSSASHAIANGCAWLGAGLVPQMLVGGSEAPLTEFGLAQMLALRIYSQYQQAPFCRPLAAPPAQNSLVLGEGAAMFLLSAGEDRESLASIEGLGFAQERIASATGLSEEGAGFARAMQAALHSAGCEPASIDAVVLHAPGTIKGDAAEVCAIQRVFPEGTPILCGCKHLLGHTFGAAGAFSLLYALWLLQAEPAALVSGLAAAPGRDLSPRNLDEPIRRVLVNSAGFGGNCVSLVVGRGSKGEPG